MPRKPTDQSNSPRGGRGRPTAGRPAGRDRPQRGSSASRDRPAGRSSAGRGRGTERGAFASRGSPSERASPSRGGPRFSRSEGEGAGAPRRGAADRGGYSNSRAPGDRTTRRPGRSSPSDRAGPYAGRGPRGNGPGEGGGRRAFSEENRGPRRADGDARRPRPEGGEERRPRPRFDESYKARGSARSPRTGEGARSSGRARLEGGDTRDTPRARFEGSDDRKPRRRFSEGGPARGPRRAGPHAGGAARAKRGGGEGGETPGRFREIDESRGQSTEGDEGSSPRSAGESGSSVWDSSPSRRRARSDSPRGEGATRGRFGGGGSKAGGPKDRPPRREKRDSAYGSRPPRHGEPQESSAPPDSDTETTPASWSGNSPPVQHEGDAPQQVDEAAQTQEHVPDEQPVRGGGGRGRQPRREEGERVQKALSRAGVGSRREVEEWIRAGRITINDEPAVLGVRVGPSDRVRLDGRLIRQRETGGAARVFLIHRSPGENLQQPVDTSEESDDESNLPIEEGAEDLRASGAASSGAPLLDRMPRRAGRRFIPVSPMPRVDGGLELVTSDGDLASKLQRSMRRLSSEFSVRIHGELSPQGIEMVSRGELDNGQKLAIERCQAGGGEGSNRWYSLVARGASGKDVRQLFERQGALVSRVLRTQLGSLALDRLLSRGQFRELTPEELEALLAAAEGGAG